MQSFAPSRTVKYLLLILLSFLCSIDLLAQHSFLEQLKPFCGMRYQGRVVFPEGDKDPFSGKDLIIYFSNCGEEEVRIPFKVGDDASRTWVLTRDKKGLLLKHDHRHEDGTPDEITQYGGYASANGTALIQHFPADAFTAKLIPAAAINEWTLALSEDRKTLSYILKRDGALRFRADFDLSKPLP